MKINQALEEDLRRYKDAHNELKRKERDVSVTVFFKTKG
jgi:hypothetical protein